MVRKIMAGLLVMLLAGLLVACGESATPTPVPPTPTPLPTVVPRPASNPAAGSGAAVGGIPAPAGATEIKIDASVVKSLLQAASIPPDVANSLQLGVYATNETADKIAADYGPILTSGGYISPLGGGGLTKQGDQYFGFLTKGGTEVLIAVQPLTADLTNAVASAGASVDVVKAVTDQLKDKKTVVLVISGAGLLQSFLGRGNALPQPSPTK